MMPWSYYASFFSWLRYGLLIYWCCADCGKRHLSTLKGWSKHIGYNVPLCRACEDALDRQYNEHMRIGELRDQARELMRQMQEAWRCRDWATMNLICDGLENDPELAAAYDTLIEQEARSREDASIESEWAVAG